MTLIKLPTLSVVIPVRNEQDYLRGCLDSVLIALDRVPPAEVLIVEGRSTDETRDIALQYGARHPRVRILDNPARVTPAAFNVGIRAARAPYIAIVSGHSELTEDFFRAALSRLEACDADIVGGPIDTRPGRPSRLAWLLAQIVSHPFGVGNSRFRVSRRPAHVDAVPFAVFRRKVFETVGLFDERLPRNQDTEFFGRVARAGIRVFLDPDVKSSYYARGTLTGFLTQGFRNAFWNVRVWRWNHHAFQWRHGIPGLFATVFWSLAFLSAVSPIAAAAIATLMVIYGASAIVASLHVALGTRRPLALLLPPLFLLYHLTYGTGSLLGLRWVMQPGSPGPPPRLSAPSADLHE